MSKTYGTVITDVGAGIMAECILDDKSVSISQAAAGDGGGAYYVPTAEQTALINECWRGEIAAAKINADNPNMLDVKVVIPDDVGGFVVREIGLFDTDGNMIAICNLPDTEKTTLSGGVSGKLTLLMHIVVADASAVEFIINSELDAVSQDELNAAISLHSSSTDCHADIRERANNSMQQGDAYTKDETDNLVINTVRNRFKTAVITLVATEWVNNVQTIAVSGIPADGDENAVFPAPSPDYQTEYVDAGIKCTAQSEGALTFTCDNAPSDDIKVNVVIFDYSMIDENEEGVLE